MFQCGNDEEEEEFGGLYEGGHWVWDENEKQLVFEYDESIPDENFTPQTPAIFGPIEFKDDMDILEQQRFRKRFQRRIGGDDDVVYLQDVKDVVLYTAPNSVLTPTVVRILHLATTDRFIRILTLYFQYFLQIADTMASRVMELETKVPTARSVEVELEYRENLEDLRLLIAKEYSTLLLGGADLKQFHHMSASKKSRSLTKKDAILFESVLRICIQIVWIILGRQSFNKIELETHRLFKSPTFNMVEHKLKTNFMVNMSPHERHVLLGHCVHSKQKLNMLSPLMNEIHCHRAMDYRLFGIGTIKFPALTSRLRFIEQTLSMNERLFQKYGLTLGILGLARSRFDTTLREIKMPPPGASSSSIRSRSISRTSRASVLKSTMTMEKLYRDIDLPSKNQDEQYGSSIIISIMLRYAIRESLPDEFPTQSVNSWARNFEQRQRWMARASRFAGKQASCRRFRK